MELEYLTQDWGDLIQDVKSCDCEAKDDEDGHDDGLEYEEDSEFEEVRKAFPGIIVGRKPAQ